MAIMGKKGKSSKGASAMKSLSKAGKGKVGGVSTHFGARVIGGKR
jgi:hypothetical protein